MTLGEVCDQVGGAIQTGPFGSQLHDSDYSIEGTPVVMPTNIVDGRISEDDIARIAPGHVQRLQRHILRRGDIVYGRRGDIGRRAIVTDREAGWLCGTGCIRVSLGDAILDPHFLFYYLGDSRVVAEIAARAVGATMPNLNTSILRSVRVSFPRLPAQQRIASILSTYDHLIENNARRIAVLEEMARRTFEEWFVHFRAPGCEGARMVDSPLGSMPRGWSASSVGDATAYVSRGIAPIYDDNASALVINQKCIRGGRVSLNVARRQSKSVPDQKLVQQFDVLINSTGVGTLGRVAQIFEFPVGTTVDGHVTIARRSEGIDPDFFGLALLRLEEAFTAAGVGSTGQTELGRERIRQQALILPPVKMCAEFGSRVRPIRQLSHLLSVQIGNLRTQRDLLLPRLISGELDVLSAPALKEAAE